MRIGFMVAAIFALGSGALAEDYGRPTAILVSPIHEAQIVRGDDGKDHVEYELLVVNVFSKPVTLSFVFDSFTSVGAIDFGASKGDRLVILPDSRQVRFAYPLYGGIQNYP
jgi:hypothetical protein